MRALHFASRNCRELIRDPLSWVFCLGFPLVMLLLMTVINQSIPAEAGMVLFEIQNLAPGIMIFGYTFIMLFTSLLISGDRKEAFLLRLYTSPMRSVDFILGYLSPMALLALGQAVVTCLTALILSAVQGATLHLAGMAMSVLFSLPAILMFIGFGILFGTLLSKNAAPGIASVIICFSGMLGGIWMDVEAIGGTLKKICAALPFFHAVKAARLAYVGSYFDSLQETGIVLIWAVVIVGISIVLFRRKMRA